MPRMRPTNIAKRPRVNARVTRGLRMLEHKMTGQWVRCSNDPPTLTSSPWNSVTVSTVVTGDKAGWSPLTKSQMLVAMRTQLGLPTAHKVDIRLRSFAAWNLASIVGDSTLDPYLAIQVYDPHTGITLSTQEDQGTSVRPACLRYIFPTRVFTSPLGADEDATILALDVQKKFKGMVHFHILWLSLIHI